MYRISALETFIVRLPFSHGGPPTGFGGVNWGTIDMLLVKVTSTDGIAGWGEAFGFNICQATRYVVDGMIAPLLVGTDVTDVPAVTDVLQRKLHLFGRNGPVNYGISGVDIALWDLAAKTRKAPLSELIRQVHGAPPALELKAYASLLRYGEVGPLASNVERSVAAGYTAVKVHETALPCIAAARRAMPAQSPLMVDVNCPWTLPEAQTAAAAMQDYGIHWLEEPIWPPEDQHAQRELRSTTNVPIALGENAGSVVDFKRIAEAGASDYLQPSVIKCGGISAMREIASICQATGVKFAPHSPYFGPGLLATLHVCAALAPDALIERLYVDLPENLYGNVLTPRNGTLQIPAGSGLGLDPALAVIEKYRAD